MVVYTRVMSVQPYEGDDEVYFAEADLAPVEDDDAIEVMWMERATKPFRPTPSHPFRATRCTATVRNGPRKGKRCGREATLGTNVCESHGANMPHVKKAAAARVNEIQLKLVGLTGDAADVLEELMHSADSGAVRLKAATEILDRSGVRGGTDLNVTVEHGVSAADMVRAKLAELAKRTIEGEVLEHGVTVDHVDTPAIEDGTPAEENP